MNMATECLWKSVSQIWQMLSTKWKLNGEIIASCIHKSLVTSTCFPKYIISSNNFDRKTNNNWINWTVLDIWRRKCKIIQLYWSCKNPVISIYVYTIVLYFIKCHRKNINKIFWLQNNVLVIILFAAVQKDNTERNGMDTWNISFTILCTYLALVQWVP